MATVRKPRKRKPPKPKAPRKAKARRTASSQYRAHRGLSSAKTFRAHKGRHSSVFKAHTRKRGLAVKHVKAAHPKVVKVKVVKVKVTHPKAKKTVVHHKTAAHRTVASHRCGQPLTHTSRKTTVHRKASSTTAHRATARHLSKAEKHKISVALTGKHRTCACKTAGAKKTKARAHTTVHKAHKETAKTRAKISARLRAKHVGTKWGKAAKGSHRGATKHARVTVLKAAKRSSGKSKAAAKRPC